MLQSGRGFPRTRPMLATVSALLVFLKIASFAAFCALLVRMYGSGLYKTYRYFTAYLLVEAIRTVVMGLMNPRTTMYGNVYFATQPVIWFLLIMVILELFGLVLRNHNGLATIGRRALLGSLVLSVALAGSTLVLNIYNPSEEHRFLNDYLVLERVVVLSLLAFVVLITAFLAYFPVPLNRNILSHAVIFSFYFLCKSGVLILRNALGVDASRQLSLAVHVLGLICLAAWTIRLTRAGEVQPAKAGAFSGAHDEARILAQLNAINTTLANSGRRRSLAPD